MVEVVEVAMVAIMVEASVVVGMMAVSKEAATEVAEGTVVEDSQGVGMTVIT
jgi:hypothetical protein